MASAPKEFRLTGRHVLVITVTAFTIIIGANMALVVAATSSFPGLVVDNSYRAGVGWNDRGAAQNALGWTVGVGYSAEGGLAVSIRDAEGEAVHGVAVDAVVGRPATSVEDVALTLEDDGAVHRAPVTLAPGMWRVALTVEGGETPYRGIAEVFVPQPRASEAEAPG
ncbi:MAG: FixH family protein [Pseudomonadota bacterium]